MDPQWLHSAVGHGHQWHEVRPSKGPPAGNARRVVGAVVLLLASCASPPAGAASRAGFCHHYLVWQATTDEVIALLERDGDNSDDWPESALGAWNYLKRDTIAKAEFTVGN